MLYTVTYRIETSRSVMFKTCFEVVGDEFWKSIYIRKAIERIKDEYKTSEVAIVMMEKMD